MWSFYIFSMTATMTKKEAVLSGLLSYCFRRKFNSSKVFSLKKHTILQSARIPQAAKVAELVPNVFQMMAY